MRCCSLFSRRRRVLMNRNNIFFFKFLTETCPWFLWSAFCGSERLSQFWPAHRGGGDSWNWQALLPVQVGRLASFVPCHLTNVAVTTGGEEAAARCWRKSADCYSFHPCPCLLWQPRVLKRLACAPQRICPARNLPEGSVRAEYAGCSGGLRGASVRTTGGVLTPWKDPLLNKLFFTKVSPVHF